MTKIPRILDRVPGTTLTKRLFKARSPVAAVTLQIAGPFRRFVGNRKEIELEGGTVGQVIRNLQALAPGFKNRLLDENGEVRRFIVVFLNGEDVSKTGGAATEVKDGDELVLAPAAAGG